MGLSRGGVCPDFTLVLSFNTTTGSGCDISSLGYRRRDMTWPCLVRRMFVNFIAKEFGVLFLFLG